MSVTSAKRPTNRGELQRLLGARRNEDGTWEIPRCPKCGATAMQVAFQKSGGNLAGDIVHMLDGGEIGCTTTVDAVITERLGQQQEPDTIVVEVAEPLPPVPAVAPPGPYDDVQYIGFCAPVSFGSNSVMYWSRIKNAGARITSITADAVTFSAGEWEYVVPSHNVAYIKRKPVVKA